MAAQYTVVSLEDMERFLKRGFRILRPQQGLQNSEYFYDLFLSPNVAIRVWTSIKKSMVGGEVGAGVGEDAIRIQFWGVKSRRPLKKGKAPIVKRTQNWRNSLQDKIEDLIEEYHDNEDYWEGSGGREPETRTESGGTPIQSGPTDKQVRYVMFLLSNVDEATWDSRGWGRRFNIRDVPSEDQIRQLPGWQVSKLIDALKDAGFGKRYAQSTSVYTYDRTDLDADVSLD